MDWISALVGAITGGIITIFAYEYKRWRKRMTERSDRKSQAASLLRSELNKIIVKWETFKKIEEMHVDPGLSNFQYELGSIARSLQNIALASETLVPKEILDQIVKIAAVLTELSQMKFFLNGGRSWNKFLELGDRVIKQCRELSERLV